MIIIYIINAINSVLAENIVLIYSNILKVIEDLYELVETIDKVIDKL